MVQFSCVCNTKRIYSNRMSKPSTFVTPPNFVNSESVLSSTWLAFSYNPADNMKDGIPILIIIEHRYLSALLTSTLIWGQIIYIIYQIILSFPYRLRQSYVLLLRMRIWRIVNSFLPIWRIVTPDQTEYKIII